MYFSPLAAVLGGEYLGHFTHLGDTLGAHIGAFTGPESLLVTAVGTTGLLLQGTTGTPAEVEGGDTAATQKLPDTPFPELSTPRELQRLLCKNSQPGADRRREIVSWLVAPENEPALVALHNHRGMREVIQGLESGFKSEDAADALSQLKRVCCGSGPDGDFLRAPTAFLAQLDRSCSGRRGQRVGTPQARAAVTQQPTFLFLLLQQLHAQTPDRALPIAFWLGPVGPELFEGTLAEQFPGFKQLLLNTHSDLKLQDIWTSSDRSPDVLRIALRFNFRENCEFVRNWAQNLKTSLGRETVEGVPAVVRGVLDGPGTAAAAGEDKSEFKKVRSDQIFTLTILLTVHHVLEHIPEELRTRALQTITEFFQTDFVAACQLALELADTLPVQTHLPQQKHFHVSASPLVHAVLREILAGPSGEEETRGELPPNILHLRVMTLRRLLDVDDRPALRVLLREKEGGNPEFRKEVLEPHDVYREMRRIPHGVVGT